LIKGLTLPPVLAIVCRSAKDRNSICAALAGFAKCSPGSLLPSNEGGRVKGRRVGDGNRDGKNRPEAIGNVPLGGQEQEGNPDWYSGNSGKRRTRKILGGALKFKQAIG